MRILLTSDHKYPALTEVGSGLHPKEFPSGSGYLIHDLMARGIAELGHEVFYLVRRGAEKTPPPGVTLVSSPIPDADILHIISDRDAELIEEWEASRKPWVATCHLDLKARGLARSVSTKNWIFVSRTLAQLFGRDRYVWNGIDPDEYIFSEAKDDYLLFMSTMDWGTQKGLDVVLALSERMGFKLVVAGTGESYERIASVQEMCRKINASYVGDVRGKEKAELLAGAKAFLFPTKVDEAFGLGMVEALMSGTPVICSDKGACPEIITSDVGFVCRDMDDYVAAVDRIAEISPQTCRDKAMKDYHYRRMSADYIVEYEKEILKMETERLA
jgi:glycosyltransferase involved in cell wall biosynthesis